MKLYEYQGSRSFINLHPRSLRFTFSNFFSLETSRSIETKFHMEPPWDKGMKICSNGLCHMTNMATMPIYGKKNLKNLLLLNQKANDLESWYAASGTWVLPNLFKWRHWVDLDIFYGKVKLIPYAFVWEKGKIMDFSETIVVCDIKVGRFSLLNEYMNHYEYQRSRSFRFSIFNLLLLRNR